MANIQLSRLQSQLMQSGLQIKDPTLYQVIDQLIRFLQNTNVELDAVAAGSGGGSAAAITALTGDVVATGPGSVPATIQPDAVTTLKIIDEAVTYAKIQDTALPDVLIGRGFPAGPVEEIELGANLQIVAGTLEITTSGGGSGGGLAHNFLSPTHPDTVPADPVFGDMVYAGEGSVFVGTYVHALILNPVEVEEIGIFGFFYIGFNGAGLLPPVCGAFSPSPFALVPSTLPETWLTQDIIDAVILNSVYTVEIGIYGFLTALVPGGTIPGPGTYVALSPPGFALLPTPSPLPDYSTGLWRRLPIDADGKVLTVVGGSPSWADLPPIPDEPAYPWVDITFVAANFTATGGVTPGWAVVIGNVSRWQFQQFPGILGVGNNVRIALFVEQTTVSGSAPTQLEITLPFNILGRFAQFVSIRENSVATTDTFILYDSAVSSNKLFISKIGGGPFDTTAAQTYLAFEISAVLAP